MAIKPKIQELLKRLNDGVYEKEDVIALALLSSVAGESIFLLGAPGVAKSLVARRLKYAYHDGSSFEYLMNRFSTPDEIFGPVSISQLKDNDKYERIVKNYLPSATVVFLDEIWKAGPSIQNALLTVLNEKVYRNGEQEIKVPMKALISASNELPSKGEGLEALWDRFLLRIIVEGVISQQNFNDMISKTLNSYDDTVEENLKITHDEYIQWSKAIDEIEISQNVFNVIHVIRSYIDKHNSKSSNKEKAIYISDRRWRKIVRLLRTSAFLNDRKAVDLMDCFLIKDCLWNETEHIKTVTNFVKDAIQKHGYSININLVDIEEELKDFKVEVNSETSYIKPVEITTPKTFEIQKKKYHRVIIKSGLLSYENNDLLLIDEIKKASKNSYIETTRFRKDLGDNDNVWIKCSSSQNKLFLSNDGKQEHELEFETDITVKDKVFTKKPHFAVIKEWDKRAAIILTKTSNLKAQIDQYKTNDLKHLRINQFVNESLAEIVEINLYDLEKEINKLEVEVRSIQHIYENIDGQSASKQTKSLKENELSLQ